MYRYLVIFEPDKNTGTEFMVCEGNDLLDAFINSVGKNNDNFFGVMENAYLQENGNLTPQEIGMVEFYDLFVNDKDWPIPIIIMDITTEDIQEVTQYDIEQIWENRNIDNPNGPISAENVDVDIDKNRELS